MKTAVVGMSVPATAASLFAGICNFYLIAAILIVGVERIVPDLQVPFCDRVEGLFLGVINYGFVYKFIFNGSQGRFRIMSFFVFWFISHAPVSSPLPWRGRLWQAPSDAPGLSGRWGASPYAPASRNTP